MAFSVDNTLAGRTTSQAQADHTLRWIAVISSFLSIGAFVYYKAQGTLLNYYDAIPHLEYSRRLTDSPTPGFGQLGGVWLPLQHVLTAPLARIDSWYYSAFAGSIVSMASYVITVVLVYKIAFALTDEKLPAVVAASVFMGNPNVLYMQATPMAEVLVLACIAGLIYGTQRWIQTDQPRYLVSAGVAGFLGTLTRYEAWVVLAAVTGIVVYACYRKRYGYARTEGTTLAFLYVGGLGVAAWLAYNGLIFGDILYFQNGEYAKPSLWVEEGELAVGNWWVSLQTYSIAVAENLWLPVLVLGIIGLTLMLIRERLALATLPVLSVLGLFPFFVLALVKGQRPLHVMQLTGDLYNVRFGLPMVLVAAVSIGYLVGTLRSRRSLMRAAAVTTSALAGSITLTGFVWPATVTTLQEPLYRAQSETARAMTGVSNHLRGNAAGDTILMESFGNEHVLFQANLPPTNHIHEGSYKLWDRALTDPAGTDVEWIVMRHAGGDDTDKVYEALDGTDRMTGYDMVYENSRYRIYKERA